MTMMTVMVEPTDDVVADLFAAFVTDHARRDPYPVYEQLRARGPIVDTGVGLWLVTGYAEVRQILRDPRFSSDESLSSFNQSNPVAPLAERPMHPSDDLDLMLFMDPPDHTRLRKLVSRSFTPRRVASVRPRAQFVVDELLASAGRSPSFDVIGSFAYPLATQVICELLGVPVADRERFGSWSSGMARAVDPGAIRSAEDNEALGAATEAFVDYFSDLIDTRRRDLGDDLLSSLIAVEAEGDRLSRDELLATGLLLLIAGHETTVNLIGNAVAALAADRDALHEYHRRPDLGLAAVDEFLRIDAPVQITQRIAVADTDIGSVVVPAGTSMVLLLGAANRDPAVFPEPGRLDFERVDSEHVSFGGGIHHCLGAALARTEGDVAIRSLVDRAPNLEITDEPARRMTFTLRGYDRLTISGVSPVPADR